MQIKEIITALEQEVPLQYQEDYDNCGLQIGNIQEEVTGILLTLDVTEEVLAEAIQKNCNLVIAHHPLLFSGLKRISENTYVERIVHKAIKNNISIYAAHTNLDNVENGVNAKIAEKLGLINTRILAPQKNILCKLYTYVPLKDADKLRNALFSAGAGNIGAYSECSYNTEGTGTFRADASAHPTIGLAGGLREWVQEIKIEVLYPKHLEQKVLKTLKENHPYEEVAFEVIPINNTHQNIGAGMIGELPSPMEEIVFLTYLKQQMHPQCIRHTKLFGKEIKKVAVCGGAGSFLLKDAIAAKADIFITADFKYHQFFNAEGKIIIADIGHYESEQFTPEILKIIITKKFPNFVPLLSNFNTNPVKYFY